MKRRRTYSKVYRKQSIFQNNRQRRAVKARSGFIKKAFLLLGLIFFIFFIHFVFTTENLLIKNIEIKGDKTFETKMQEIAQNELKKKKFILFKNNNFILFNGSVLENIMLKNIKELKSVEVSKKIPNKIIITAKEKVAKIIWQSSEKKYLIDEEGYVLKEVDNNNGLPVVVDSHNLPIKQDKPVVLADFINTAENISNKLAENKIDIEYTEIKDTTFLLRIITKQGYIIILDSTKNINNQIEKLKETIKQLGPQINIVEYIDLTVKNKAIYKLK